MALNAEELDQRFTQIIDRYRQHFAAQQRATRDLSILDALIEETRALLPDAAGDTADAVREQLELMLRERTAIETARLQHPSVIRANAWHTVHRATYRRRFAGQSRTTRDPGLLREIVGHYAELIAEVEAAGAAESERKRLSDTRATYTREITEIEFARKSGTDTERAQRYGQLANDQFALYRRHFAGQSRHTRSVPLLRRLVASLTEIRALMLQLPIEGGHAGNVKVVTERLQTYEQEIGHVLEAKRGQGVLAVSGALGGAANKLFQEYREHFAGQSRRTRSLELLFQITDGLVHIARELEAVVAQPDSTETQAKNLRIIMDQIRTYVREADEIAEAQRGHVH